MADQEIEFIVKAITEGVDEVGTLADSLTQAGDAAKKAGDDTGQFGSESGKAADETSNLSSILNALKVAFVGLVSYEALKTFFDNMTASVVEAKTAFKELSDQSSSSGIEIADSLQAAVNATSDGLLTITESSTAIKNLMAAGFGLDQATEIIGRFKDSVGQNELETKAFGDAVVTATANIKDGKEGIIDVSKVLDDYAASIGTTQENLTSAQKVQIEYKAIMDSTNESVGKSISSSETLAQATVRLKDSLTQLNVAMGIGAKESLGTELYNKSLTILENTGTSVVKNFLYPAAEAFEKAGNYASQFTNILYLNYNEWMKYTNIKDTNDLVTDSFSKLVEANDKVTERYRTGLLPAQAELIEDNKRLASGFGYYIDEVIDADQKGKDAFKNTSDAIRTAITDINTAANRADALRDALSTALQAGAVAGSAEGFKSLGGAIDAIKYKTQATEDEIRQGLSAALDDFSGVHLLSFQEKSRAAFDAEQITWEELTRNLSAALDASFNKLGLSLDTIRGQTTLAGTDIIGTFRSIALNSNTSANEMQTAFISALGKLRSEGDLRAFTTQVKEAFDAHQVDGFDTALQLIAQRIFQTKLAVDPLTTSFQALGIKSQEQLELMAEAAKTNYDAIVAAQKRGEVSTDDVTVAQQRYEQAVNAVNATLGIYLQRLGDESSEIQRQGGIVKAQYDTLLADSQLRQQAAQAAGDETTALHENYVQRDLQYRQGQADLILRQQAIDVSKDQLAQLEAQALKEGAVTDSGRLGTEQLQRQSDAIRDGIAVATANLATEQDHIDLLGREADAAQRATQATRDLSAAHDAELGGFAGGLVKIMDDYITDLGKLSTETANAWAAQQGYTDLIKGGATSAAEGLKTAYQALGTAVHTAATDLGDFTGFANLMDGWAISAANLKVKFYEQSVEVQNLAKRLGEATVGNVSLEQSATAALQNTTLLGSQQLDPLRQALADAKSRAEAFNSTVQQLVSSIGTDLSNALGDTAYQEAVRFNDQIQQLTDARNKATDAAQLAQLNTALANANKLHQINLLNIQIEEDKTKEAAGVIGASAELARVQAALDKLKTTDISDLNNQLATMLAHIQDANAALTK